MAAEVAPSLARYCGLREEQWSASCELSCELLELCLCLKMYLYLYICVCVPHMGLVPVEALDHLEL